MANLHIIEYYGGVLVSYASKVQKGRVVVDICDGNTMDVNVYHTKVMGTITNFYSNVSDYCG